MSRSGRFLTGTGTWGWFSNCGSTAFYFCSFLLHDLTAYSFYLVIFGGEIIKFSLKFVSEAVKNNYLMRKINLKLMSLNVSCLMSPNVAICLLLLLLCLTDSMGFTMDL